jgi:hypothetical protein
MGRIDGGGNKTAVGEEMARNGLIFSGLGVELRRAEVLDACNAEHLLADLDLIGVTMADSHSIPALAHSRTQAFPQVTDSIAEISA